MSNSYECSAGRLALLGAQNGIVVWHIVNGPAPPVDALGEQRPRLCGVRLMHFQDRRVDTRPVAARRDPAHGQLPLDPSEFRIVRTLAQQNPSGIARARLHIARLPSFERAAPSLAVVAADVCSARSTRHVLAHSPLRSTSSASQSVSSRRMSARRLTFSRFAFSCTAVQKPAGILSSRYRRPVLPCGLNSFEYPPELNRCRVIACSPPSRRSTCQASAASRYRHCRQP